jgi:hypothetical protein
VICSSQDHLETGTRDLDHLVLAGAKNTDTLNQGFPYLLALSFGIKTTN